MRITETLYICINLVGNHWQRRISAQEMGREAETNDGDSNALFIKLAGKEQPTVFTLY